MGMSISPCYGLWKETCPAICAKALLNLRIHHGLSMVIHQVSGDDNGHFKINDPGGYPNKLLVEYWIYSLWGP